MTVDEFLQRLEGVRPCGRGKWSARCPAHTDKSPSLSIAEGADGRILLHDFAGCPCSDIVAALDLGLKDLFTDARVNPVEKRQREQARRECARQRDAERLQVDRLREADYLVHSARGIDISNWSDEQLDAALNRLGDAYAILETEKIS